MNKKCIVAVITLKQKGEVVSSDKDSITSDTPSQHRKNLPGKNLNYSLTKKEEYTTQDQGVQVTQKFEDYMGYISLEKVPYPMGMDTTINRDLYIPAMAS